MKKYRVFLLTAVLLSLLSGCNLDASIPSGEITEPRAENTDQVMPRNIIQIGDSFEYYPSKASGHFLCTVTDVRLVEKESECLPGDEIDGCYLFAYPKGQDQERMYKSDEWFTAGGAFDLGARFVFVEITVTNEDAVALLNDGTFTSPGWFNDPYAFYAYDILQIADLSVLRGWGGDEYFSGPSSMYFSRWGEYAAEDDPDTVGIETSAIQILPGQTVSYTLGFPIHGETDGKMPNLSKMWLYIKGSGKADGHAETGVFIDTKLDEG